MRCTFLLAVVASCLGPIPGGRAEDKAAVVSYDRDVLPVFRKHCLTCHNPERPRGELDLSTYAAALAESASGKPAVAGKPEQSLIYTLAAHLETPKMPPNSPKIPQRELDILRRWIEAGMPEKADSPTTAVKDDTSRGGLTTVTRPARPTPLTALAVSPTQPLAAVSGVKQVLLFDLATRKPLGALGFPEGEVHSLRFSWDGKTLLVGGGVGGASGKVVGFEVGSWKRLFSVGEELDAVLSADLSRDGTRVVLGGPSRLAKVVSVPEGKPVHTFRKPTDWVTATGFSPDGLLVAAGDRFGGLFVWEAQSGKEFWVLRGHTQAVTSLSWRDGGDVLVSGSEDGTIHLWDLHQGLSKISWKAHAGGVTAIDCLPTGQIVSGGRDNQIKVWSAEGKLLATPGTMKDTILRVAGTADGKSVLATSWGGELHAWPAAGGEAVPLPIPLASAGASVVLAPAPQLRPSVAITPTGAADPRVAPLLLELAEARRSARRSNEEVASLRKVLEGRAEAAQLAQERVRKLEGEILRVAGRPAPNEAASLALESASDALARLRQAAGQAPENRTLARAVEEAERAVRDLAAQLTKTPAP